MPLQPPDLVEDRVEAEPGDELHRVVVQPVVLADAEDRHDVRVVQPRRGPGLAVEPADLLGGPGDARGQHLQGDVPAERLLLGLVDDAHAAAADLAEDAVVAQPLEGGPRPARPPPEGVVGQVALGLELLDEEQGREEVADLVGELGVARGELAGGGPLAAAEAVEELLGQRVERVAALAGIRHLFDSPRVRVRAPIPPAPEVRPRVRPVEGSARPWVFPSTALSRSRART